MLAVGALFRAYILAAVHQKIKGVEAGPAMKEQIAELWPAALIPDNDLTIWHRFSSKRRGQSLAKVRSLPNERCQHRLVAKSQRLNGRGGRRSSGIKKRPDISSQASFIYYIHYAS